MANWATAESIAERYMVGEARLLAYAARGNLPCWKEQGSPTLFDESVCARLFRPKRAAIVTYREPKGPHMGILGVTEIGADATAPLQSQRRRAARAFSDFFTASEELTRRKAIG